MPDTAEAQYKFQAGACAIEQVVVYTDRAEVTRRVEVEPEGPGLATVVVSGFSTRMDPDSVRVKGVGNAKILEVSTDYAYDDVEDGDAEGTARERRELEDQGAVAHRDVSRIRDATVRVQRERDMLEKYCMGVAAPGEHFQRSSKSGGDHSLPCAPAVGAEDMAKVLEMFAQRAEVADAKLADLQEELTKAQDLLKSLRSRLSRLESPARRQSRSIKVRLSIASTKEALRLLVTSMASGASWTPSYDARASMEGGPGALSLQLTYSGMVVNSTGEDWKDATLALSTAQPAVGGSPPALPTLVLDWKQEDVPRRAPARLGARMARAEARTAMSRGAGAGGGPEGAPMFCQAAMTSNACVGFASMHPGDDEAETFEAPLPPPTPTSAVTASLAAPDGHAGAARFEIEHTTTVLSDGAPHKVTVAVIELKPEVHHFAAPTREPRAYLQARTPNASNYPLLASDNCSIYVDGTFVCKSSLPLTMPGEHFHMFLGPDPAVKVEARPMVTKDAASEGSIFRSSTKARVSTQTVLVTNTRADRAAKVHVAMLFPRAQNDRIKVVLLEPAPSEVHASDEAGLEVVGAEGSSGAKSGGVTIVSNKTTNNLVWMVPIPPGGKHTILLKYRIEHPAERDITQMEVPPATSLR